MRIAIVGVALAVVALAACSGDEASMVEKVPAGASPQPLAAEADIMPSGDEGPDAVEPDEAAPERTTAAPTVATAPVQGPEHDTPHQTEPTLQPPPDDGCHLLPVTERCATLSVVGISGISSARYHGCRELKKHRGDYEMLDCLPEGTRLVDVGVAWQDSQGVPWRRVRTVGGIDGWIEDRFLEGAKAGYTGPIPWVIFPDDVAVLVLSYRSSPKGYEWPSLERIYRESGDGRIVRETLFSTRQYWSEECGDVHEEDYFSVDYDSILALSGHLPECGGYYFQPIGTSDASSIFMTVCVEYPCRSSYFEPGATDDQYGRTAIYESKDGGVTWERLVGFDRPWIADLVLPGGDKDDRLLLIANRPFIVDDAWVFPDPILWPDGETVKPPKPPEGYDWPQPRNRVVLDDGRPSWGFEEGQPVFPAPERAKLYLTAEGEDVTELVLEETNSCPKCQILPDGRGLLLGWDVDYYADELMGGAAVGYYSDLRGYYSYGFPRFWPTIRDSETGEQWPIQLPHEVLALDNLQLQPVAIQHGPFLRVVDIGENCLPLRSDSSPDADELACVAERVLLQDRGDRATDDGITWHRVRTPAGVEGWADGSYLE